jgi:adenine deaminase
VKNGTWFCPTLVLDRRFFYFPDEIDTNNYPGLQYIPFYWIEKDWEPYLKRMLKEWTVEKASIYKRLFQKQLEITGEMYLAGVQFLAGTDTGAPYLIPGFSLHEELALLVKAGLTPMEALQTATINPAAYLGIQDSLGTIEENKIADLVLLDSNPLEDISNTQRINAVVLGGKFLSKESLQKMLAGVKDVISKRRVETRQP